uniref:Uncharacterized protein n=1 Tax=Amphimedon queenslandica TaxID=400682 RepID=A0A1X7SZS9_AMPQE
MLFLCLPLLKILRCSNNKCYFLAFYLSFWSQLVAQSL